MTDKTLAELATQYPASIELFEQHGLDYYQKGRKITLKEACKTYGLEEKKLNAELVSLKKQAPSDNALSEKLTDIDIEDLVDYINITFHAKEKTVLKNIHSHIQKVLTDKSNNQSFIHFIENVEEIFVDLMNNFSKHCSKEDKVLFPYIKKLVRLYKSKNPPKADVLDELNSPIHNLESEHEKAAATLAEIKKWMQGITLPQDCPESFSALQQSLEAFEKELHMHLHLENNILFPKCLEMENQLRKR